MSSPSELHQTFIVALLVHMLVIFGVTFGDEIRDKLPHSMEVTLARFSSPEKVKNADFVAQSNQQGSGTEEQRRQLTTDEKGIYADNVIREALQQKKQEESNQTPVAETVLHTSDSRYQKNMQPHSVQATEKQSAHRGNAEIEKLSLEIASLEAKIARQQQAYAKRPRVHRITSVSTTYSSDALYQLQWQRLVESAGNRNYPRDARKRQLEGDVRLMVALFPDGSVRSISMLASSGHKILDDAAVNSVHAAAPFAPFTGELAARADILEIIRTWQYRGNHLTSR